MATALHGVFVPRTSVKYARAIVIEDHPDRACTRLRIPALPRSFGDAWPEAPRNCSVHPRARVWT